MSTSASHLQPVTSLAVDPTSTFFLSGSSDANVHVWSLPSILSFSPDAARSPVHTLSTHRGPVSCLACGHSSAASNIAVSISQDKSAVVWNYHSGKALRTYLLPELPEAVALDPADRAMYITYSDGSLQTVDFYDHVQKATPIDMVQDISSSHRPLQPSTRMRFHAESQKLGAALSLGISWDGTTLVSGHASGKVAAWDTAKRTWISVLANLPGPVTNLHFLEPTGFPGVQQPPFKLHTAVKPKQDLGPVNGTAIVPPNYSLTMQFTGQLPVQPISATRRRKVQRTDFEEALSHPSFPQSMLEDSLAELSSWNAPFKGHSAPTADFLSFDEDDTTEESNSSVQLGEVAALKKQLASLQRVQKVTFEQLSDLRQENTHFRDLERRRSQRAQRRRAEKKSAESDVEMGDESPSSNESESVHADSVDESEASGSE